MKEYAYDISIDVNYHKHWQYIEKVWNKIVLNNGDSIKINLNIQSKDPLDIVEIRFYNICNKIRDGIIGKLYVYVDGKPALPTIGVQSYPIPTYFAIPMCPKYGTIKTDVWDTDDTIKTGLTEYRYIYKGYVPLIVKTLELYIVKK